MDELKKNGFLQENQGEWIFSVAGQKPEEKVVAAKSQKGLTYNDF
jgi:hypothetical protein